MLGAERSKHLPPIKRGSRADVYLTSSGQILLSSHPHTQNPLIYICVYECVSVCVEMSQVYSLLFRYNIIFFFLNNFFFFISQFIEEIDNFTFSCMIFSLFFFSWPLKLFITFRYIHKMKKEKEKKFIHKSTIHAGSKLTELSFDRFTNV